MIIIDILICIMLIISIVYNITLNRKISELKNYRNELKQLSKDFNLIIKRTELNIKEIKELVATNFADLQKKIDYAKFLTNDLAFLTDRANLLAEKLDNKIENDRQNHKPNIERLALTENNKQQAIESLLEKMSSVNRTRETSPIMATKKFFKSLTNV